MAGAIVVLLGFAALAIDLAYIMEAKAELQNAADATALAAVSSLLGSGDEHAKRINAISRAVDYAARNKVAGQTINPTLDNPDRTKPLEFGRWNPATKTFQVLDETSSASGVRVNFQIPTPLTLFFARVLGHTDAAPKAVAIATSSAAVPRDIVMTLDRSYSMVFRSFCQNNVCYPVGNPPQYQPLGDVKTAAKFFLDRFSEFQVEGDRVGLVTFGTRAGIPYPACPPRGQPCPPLLPPPPTVTADQALSEDFAPIQKGINDYPAVLNIYEFGFIKEQLGEATNIAAGLCLAGREIGRSVRPNTKNIVVLLSDGEANKMVDPATCAYKAPTGGLPENGGRQNCDPRPVANGWTVAKCQALDQARKLASSNVTLHTISLYNVASDYDPRLLKILAQEGHGRFFDIPAGTPQAQLDQMKSVFEELAKAVGIGLVK